MDVVPEIVAEATTDIDEIMRMLDLNGNGKVSWTEFLSAIMSLTDMLGMRVNATNKGEMKYMWTLLDTDQDGELTHEECRAILDMAPLITKLNNWATKTLNVGEV